MIKGTTVRLRVNEKIANRFVNWLMVEKPKLGMPMSDFERIKHEIRLCDVVLIEGRNRVSEVIKLVTQSRWSHAALYIGRLHDVENLVLRKHIQENYHGDPQQQLLIESYLGRGTIVTPMDEYEGHHIRVCRPAGVTRQDAQQVMSYAISHLGIAYDLRQIIDLMRYMFPWNIVPRRLRSSLFHYHAGTGTRQICSTLLAEAFASIQFPILPHVTLTGEGDAVSFVRRNPRLCTPSDFDYSPYFEILKFPLFEMGGHAIYRNLPWVADQLSNDAEGIYTTTHDGKPTFVKRTSRKDANTLSTHKPSLEKAQTSAQESAQTPEQAQLTAALEAAEQRLKVLEEETNELSALKQQFKKIQDKPSRTDNTQG